MRLGVVLAVVLALGACSERQGLDFDVQYDDAGAPLPDAQAPRQDGAPVVQADGGSSPGKDAQPGQTDATAPPKADGGPVQGTDAQPQPGADASPGADRMPQADTMPQPGSDAGGTVKADGGAVKQDGGAVDPTVGYCQPQPQTGGACGERDMWGDWHFTYKGGRACSDCRTGTKIIAGCWMSTLGPDAVVREFLCVSSCSECGPTP